MKRRLLFLNLLCFSVLFGLPLTSMGQSSELQTIVDPLTVSGEVGTQITSSWNNSGTHYNSPFSTTAYANMIFNIYGISVPMSVNLINTNAKQFSFSDPVFTINFRPMWKGFTFHIGTSCMNFSNYTYNGISFTGGGVEYKGKSFRFGGFYGKFNHATTFSTEFDDRDAIQYLSDSLLGMNNVAYTTYPQFDRKAYAAHMAIGSKRNYLDFSLLHAADKLESLPAQWYMYNVYSSNVIDTTLIMRDSTIKGKENLALGLKGHFTIGKGVTFEANLGASLFTPDIVRDEMVLTGGGGTVAMANKLMGGLRKSTLFNFRYGSEIHFAGDAMLSFKFKPVSATLTYRFVDPDYTTLGANGFNQNARTFGGNFSTSLFHNTARLSLNGYLQRDNLDKKQKYTNQVGSYTVNWSNYFGESVGLSIMYHGVKQNQYDGVLVVPENTRIDQITHSFDFSPSYTLSLNDDHTFSLDFNLLQNKNLNEQLEGLSFNITTLSYGLGYEVYLSAPRVSLNASYEFSQSHSFGSNYNSHSLYGGTSFYFIKKEDLSLSGNARLTMAFNEEREIDELTDSEKQVLDYLAHRLGKEVGTQISNDLSIAGRIGATLRYKDQHYASTYFAISNYSDNIIVGQHVAISTDVRFMLEYSYSFASRLIKSKKHK